MRLKIPCIATSCTAALCAAAMLLAVVPAYGAESDPLPEQTATSQADVPELIQVARPSEEYDGWSYQDVVKEFEQAGFTNIVLEPIGDLNFVSSLVTPDGRIESVTVGEATGFTREATFPADTPVVIRYHTFQSSIDQANSQAAYDEATALFDEGSYEEARAAFEALGDFSDASEMAVRSWEEQRAVDLLAADPAAALVQVPRHANDYDGWSYWDVVAEFEQAGFANVSIEPIGDLFVELGNKDGQVERIQVGDQDYFTGSARFAADTPVVVSFHTYQDRIDRGDYDQGAAEEAPADEQRHYLGTVVNTGLDNGYSGSEQIGVDDRHYGWEIGRFFVSDFTRVTQDDEGNPVFLKNVGDTVTLWFNLEQAVSHLDGNADLTVSDDTNGYYTAFGVDKTDLGRGALLVRYTDYQNNTSEPQIYTDYLAAKTVGADTKVQLFEEGDYEVVLLYELEYNPRRIGDFAVAPSYSNYRISFKFSVRNSNCMVYPFDAQTGAELADNAVAENGFYLDLARSRYLDIDIRKEIEVEGQDGLVEDTRFNRAAADGDAYTEEGIYTITVSNRYTGETTTKTIRVGDASDAEDDEQER